MIDLETAKRIIEAPVYGNGHRVAGVVSLPEVRAIFKKRLYMRDTDIVDVTAGFTAANILDGDPTWGMIVGPPGGGKTEVLLSVVGLPFVKSVATLTESALLSGTPKREKANDASGGLLREIGAFGILLLKDFGSILSMNRDARAGVLAALRELYDGSWTRYVGSDGGRKLSWSGKLGILAGATPIVDTHHAVISALGERFLMYRIPEIDARQQAQQALENVGHIGAVRRDLAEAMSGLLAPIGAGSIAPALTDTDKAGLVAISILAVRCRSAVERDGYKREIEYIPDPEAPGRLAGALARLLGALKLLGCEPEQTRRLVLKVGLDCMPATRRQVFDLLRQQDAALDTTAIATATGYPTTTARRTVEDLTAHGVTERLPGGSGKADKWALTDWAKATYAEAEAWPRGFPEMSEDSPSLITHHVYDDISGKVSPASVDGASQQNGDGPPGDPIPSAVDDDSEVRV